MSPLVLTTARRAELSRLLEDERALEAEYPAVAEYLDTAAGLQGTGDSEADRTFDLRMLHFMTGDASVSENPYWDIVAPSVSHRGHRRIIDGGHLRGSSRLAYAQTVLQSTYAYAVPSPETIQWVSRFSDGRPIIELGAGRGYWAAQLSRVGTPVDAYDSAPPDVAQNSSFPPSAKRDTWHHVGNLEDFRTRATTQAGTVLFLCWPPGWENAMASEALESFESAGGDRLIYIGEPRGGKTANEAFFTALDRRWKLDSTDEHFVSWWNLNDAAQGWVRR